jgi:hypothetical protein
MKHILVPIILALLFLFQAACKEKNDVPDLGQYSNQIILDWNLVSYEAMGGATTVHGLLAVRVHAMVHLAMHDALNAVAQRYQTYAFHQNNVEADPIAAVSSAAYEVLVASNPDQKSMLDGQLAASLAKVPEGKSKTEGIQLGKAAAHAMLELRKNDGAFQDPIGLIPPSTGQPGTYQAVPPFDFVFAPNWKTMQPFSLEKPEQFRMEIFPALTSGRYATDFNEVKRIGQKDSPDRSSEQTFIAKFWYEYSEIGWNRIARVTAAERKLDILATARLFALVNMALSDAYTAGWDAKFHYNFWRPYTAIRAAETDGNPETIEDLAWEPSEPTPPVQDYPSTHSALGNAAATVLAAVLGESTSFSFTSTTAVPSNAARSFNSFTQAANENADSRVLAGIHFRFSCEKGQELGNKIGKWTMENHLKPVK